MTNIPLQLNNVSKHFGDVHAVNGVSLSVAKGQMFGLIGRNGAGKTTLFKLMLGLIPASGGEIRLHGELISGSAFRETRRRIGYLPENFVTYDNLTGLEVLRLFADLKQVPRNTCEGILARVGLSEAAKRRVRGYSKGMRQRLGFAQVLLGKPDLIFLDEPTNGLDAEGIHDFYRILGEVQSQGATIIITSHILAEIQNRVNSLVILDSGQIAAQGTLAELRANMVLPSVIEVTFRADREAHMQSILSGVAGLDWQMEHKRVRISCAANDKVGVLAKIMAVPDAVLDIAVHEPSLEDVFLGYGGNHVQAH
ncbi:MAG: ABC transporter ATP-binding protein [Herbaspirillum sp.]